MLQIITKCTFISILLVNSYYSLADCSLTEINAVRKSAANSFVQKNYSEAESKLSKYYKNDCSLYNMKKSSEDTLQRGLWLISDLMLYKHKINDELGCLDLHDDLYATFMVSEPSLYGEKVKKALSYNAKQCQMALDKPFLASQKCQIKGHEDMLAIPKIWQKEDPIYFEISCIRFVENSKNIVGGDRDGPQLQSEGMQDIAKLEVLYVDSVSDISGIERNANSDFEWYENAVWSNNYKLDQLYFINDDNSLWDTDYCFYFPTIKLGKKAGMLLLDGSSSPCNGGRAANLNKMIVKLNYPLNVEIIKNKIHGYR